MLITDSFYKEVKLFKTLFFFLFSANKSETNSLKYLTFTVWVFNMSTLTLKMDDKFGN